MILCYLDTSEKNISIEEQRQIVTNYTNQHSNISIDIFFNDADISSLIQSLTTQDNLIISANIVCYGKTLRDIKNNIETLINKHCSIISVVEDYILTSDTNANIFIRGLEYAINIRNSLSSIVTKKALNDKKANGFVLGRTSRNKKRILDDKADEIMLRKIRGENNLQIAKALGVAPTTLYAFYKLHPKMKTVVIGDK